MRQGIEGGVEALGLEASAVLRVLDPPAGFDLEPQFPMLGVWWGEESPGPEQLRVLDEMQVLGAAVLPVVSDLDRFEEEVPENLHPINGLEWGWHPRRASAFSELAEPAGPPLPHPRYSRSTEVDDEAMSPEPERPALFLAAGVPDQPERGPYVETSDPVAIRDSVRALTGVALARGYTLVFGGHPAVSPLVWQVADSLGKAESVVIYQSRLYKEKIPKEAHYFNNLEWTETGGDKKESLALMRRQMLGSRTFAAAVLIGGMDGVEREEELFGRLQPRAPIWPIASTGGAARIFYERGGEHRRVEHSLGKLPPDLRHRLHRDHSYRSLFEDLLRTVE